MIQSRSKYDIIYSETENLNDVKSKKKKDASFRAANPQKLEKPSQPANTFSLDNEFKMFNKNRDQNISANKTSNNKSISSTNNKIIVNNKNLNFFVNNNNNQKVKDKRNYSKK
jgi:hypothetical protein